MSTKNKKALHEGMSYGICTKCKQEFKLKRKTKHDKLKRPKGVCHDCGIKNKQ